MSPMLCQSYPVKADPWQHAASPLAALEELLAAHRAAQDERIHQMEQRLLEQLADQEKRLLSALAQRSESQKSETLLSDDIGAKVLVVPKEQLNSHGLEGTGSSTKAGNANGHVKLVGCWDQPSFIETGTEPPAQSTVWSNIQTFFRV